MLKKILASLIIISIIGIPVFSASQFPDLPESHWGYSSVVKLVNDGTVRGYEDGSFRPDNTVTRAEFVKMMGVGPERKSGDYSDVPKSHWGYDYIMTSGFEINGTNFEPDKPITRDEVVFLLWKRQGSMGNIIAPSIITNQSSLNKDAVAWAYNYKIMKGDDGLNLRLNDSISRVEAAALIIRTRETDYSNAQASFASTVSYDILKAVFESFELMDGNTVYSPDQTLTNGEMARMALRIASGTKTVLYSNYSFKADFEHKYAKDVAIITQNTIEKGIASAEFADKLATVEDTVSAFVYATIRNSKTPVSFGNVNKLYKDVSSGIASMKNVYLTFAYENGIQLSWGGMLNAKKAVTHKDVAALLLQLDNISGLHTAFSTAKDDKGVFKKYNVKLNYNTMSYPYNKADFKCILAGIDNSVYEAKVNAVSPAYNMYNFASEYSDLWISKVAMIADYVKSAYGAEIEFIVYPNLVWESGTGLTLRMLCKVNSVTKNDVNVAELFEGMLVFPVSGNLKEGMQFFVDYSIDWQTILGA